MTIRSRLCLYGLAGLLSASPALDQYRFEILDLNDLNPTGLIH